YASPNDASGGGALVSFGTAPTPYASPAHTTIPSVRTPHVWLPPAAIAVYVPTPSNDGAVPQHVTVPSGSRAHACSPPAARAVKCPAGGWMIGPLASESPPQHGTVPSTRSPHEKSSPVAIAMNVPAGGVAWPKLFSPQQVTEPSVRIAHVWPPPTDA